MYLPGRTLTPSESGDSCTGDNSAIVVLYADVRAFSSWSQTRPVTETSDLVNYFYTSTWQIVNDTYADFCKLLGDGCLLLWEAGEKSLELCIKLSFDAAHDLHKSYYYHNKETDLQLPSGLGIGISTGSAVKVQPATIITELNEIDFVGYPMNCGARMQSLAGPFGTVIDHSTRTIIEKNPIDFLCTQDPSFTRDLCPPSAAAIAKAQGMNGLSALDSSEFRYVTFSSTMAALWGVKGIL